MTLYIPWNPNPDLVNIGGFAIKWYGAMWAIALILGYFLGKHVFRWLNRDEDKLTLLMQYMFIGGLLGARLGQVLFYQPEYFWHNPGQILNIRMGGLASHGGTIGIIIAMWLFVRSNKEFSLLWALDGLCIVAYIPMTLIRFGNLMNSEIVGSPADVPWAFIFYANGDGIPRHPVVIYELIYYAILGCIVVYTAWKVRDTMPGLYFIIFLIAPFTGRILLEFFKEPEGSLYFNTFSNTQLLSVPFILTGIYLLTRLRAGKLSYTNNG
jgi:phosphatidylglycerol:prolipoprotein diacylglycerol transferase